MRLLLDTHALLWWLTDDETLKLEATNAIKDPGSQVFVSAASVWEIAIKENSGQLRAPEDLLEALKAEGFAEMMITAVHAYAAGQLPRHHDDPFDRMLVAQARAEGLTIVTRDPRIMLYDVRTLAA